MPSAGSPAGLAIRNEPNKKAKSAAARQVLIELAADGTEMKSMVRDDEIRQHIEGLLRLNADQFRRLVVLPRASSPSCSS
jgi:DNA repair exonuclease SbcCD ATPase subunit